MSLDKNILKTLLNKLLENRLKRLEKRNTEEEKDLKILKTQYEKQGELLFQLTNKKKETISRKKTYEKFHYNYKSPIRKKKEDQNLGKYKLSTEKKAKNISKVCHYSFETKKNHSIIINKYR